MATSKVEIIVSITNEVGKMDIKNLQKVLSIVKAMNDGTEIDKASDKPKSTKKPSKTKGTVPCYISKVEDNDLAVHFTKGCPRKVFQAIVYALKNAKAKYEPSTKYWVFADTKSRDAFIKTQEEYGK